MTNQIPRSYRGNYPAETPLDGKPMPFFTSAHTSNQKQLAKQLAKYVVVNGLNMSAACRAVPVGRKWPDRHAELVSWAIKDMRAKIEKKQRQTAA